MFNVSDRSKLNKLLIRVWVLALGICLFGAGHLFEYKVLKADVDAIVVNLGALFAVIGVLQTVFDDRARKQLMSDIYATVLGSVRVRDAGIVDAVSNSLDVDYSAAIRYSHRLVIGVHYSAEFFKKYMNCFSDRAKSTLQTTIALIDPDGEAAKYLIDNRSARRDIQGEIDRIHSVLSECCVQYETHNRVLRYTFVMADNDIWVRFFTNGEWRSHVPAIHLTRGGKMFGFFESDINKFLEQSRAYSQAS